MTHAAVTFVYNESVNLPIWLRHYGASFGLDNLFVIDRSSTDGSTTSMHIPNLIRLPYKPFDDVDKSTFLSHFHKSLLTHYDCVAVTDCDEMIFPDPRKYANLKSYLDQMKPDYAHCIGLNVRHILTQEAPLELDRPILSQRSYATFRSDSCKPLLSSVPITWVPGGHGCDKPPKFDPDLYQIHLKFMDYTIAMRRQAINKAGLWSEGALAANHGVHHRYELDRFVREGFLDPLTDIANNNIQPFDFTDHIVRISEETIFHDGFYHLPMQYAHSVKLPQEFAAFL